ncbi:MAG: hypothetical protein ACLRR1_13060 [Alistipes shahii]|uniref:hypothetical protein n=1 Tax=Alistipes shahii TaxID=328814 RepID=UPI00399095A9
MEITKPPCSNRLTLFFTYKNQPPELAEQDKDLLDLFEIVKTAIREKGAISISGERPIQLTRRDYFSKDVVAYMNIDYLVERQKLSNTIYDSIAHLQLALEAQGHKVTFENRYGTFPPVRATEKDRTSKQGRITSNC